VLMVTGPGTVNGTGRSAPTRARNDAAAGPPLVGPARTVLAFCGTPPPLPIAFCTNLVFAAASVASLFGLSGTMQFPFPSPQPCASAAVFQNSARAGEEHELFSSHDLPHNEVGVGIAVSDSRPGLSRALIKEGGLPRERGQDDCGAADLGSLWSGRDRDSSPRGGDEDHRNAVSVRTQGPESAAWC
jgi:hypothetical protein